MSPKINPSDAATPSGPQTPEEVATLLGNVERDITQIKADVDQLMQPLVDALKRNRYFDEMQTQLRSAQKVARAWHDWPLITGIHEAVLMLRSNPQGADRYLLEHLESLIFQAGVTEYGLVGEIVDIEEVEVVAVTGNGDRFVVSQCKRPGLRIETVPLRKPIVEITRETQIAP
ncbi:hypothetical protein V5R04_14700 [Jonesiaceae bacterium BS-20]|uniref:Uncharacterized protein n=1 Tax=Jonesiaceae bacterium BS-20 TaxID=3120821 RepID=A0AAU7DVZ4_9MICO